MRGELVAVGLGERLERVLAGAVEAVAGDGETAPDRRDMDEQAAAALTHVRKDCAVEADGAEDVDVEQFARLLAGERLGEPVEQHPGVVDEDVDPARLGEDPFDGRIDRCLVRHVKFDRFQRKGVGSGERAHPLGRRGVASLELPHSGEDAVTAPRKRLGGQFAGSVAAAGDDGDRRGVHDSRCFVA